MLFSRKKKVVVVGAHHVPEYIVFNVDNFNNWFNAKDNRAVYAHSGIFLRTDKLSESCIEDYIEKCYGLSGGFLWSKPTHEMYREFHQVIMKDWRKKLSEL